MNITILTQKKCYECNQVKDILNQIRIEHPDISIKEVDTETKEGVKMADDLGVLALPAILINNKLFSTGFVTKDDILKQMAE